MLEAMWVPICGRLHMLSPSLCHNNERPNLSPSPLAFLPLIGSFMGPWGPPPQFFALVTLLTPALGYFPFVSFSWKNYKSILVCLVLGIWNEKREKEKEKKYLCLVSIKNEKCFFWGGQRRLVAKRFKFFLQIIHYLQCETPC